jgi:hypothetical protein
VWLWTNVSFAFPAKIKTYSKKQSISLAGSVNRYFNA